MDAPFLPVCWLLETLLVNEGCMLTRLLLWIPKYCFKAVWSDTLRVRSSIEIGLVCAPSVKVFYVILDLKPVSPAI